MNADKKEVNIEVSINGIKTFDYYSDDKVLIEKDNI